MIWQKHCLLSQAHATTTHAQTCLTERVACQPPDDLVKWELTKHNVLQKYGGKNRSC